MKRPSFWRRHTRLAWALGGVLTALVAIAIALAVLIHRVQPFLKARIVAGLQDHFHSRVELDTFHVSLVHGIRAEGGGLRIWLPAQVHGVTIPGGAEPGQPLVSLQQFRFRAPLRLSPSGPIYIPSVQLTGLSVNLPPRSHFEHLQPPPPSNGEKLKFEIGVVECNQAHLLLGASKPGKLPMDFEISHFKVTDIHPNGTMRVQVELINPKPVGVIYSTAQVGPWRSDDPGETPMTGDFRFDHADLSTLKGIAGILSSTGRYTGTLRNLTVDGETETPDFRLAHFSNALDLHTRYHAKVDGTDGDTWLEPVEATLGRSHFWAQGQIVRVRVPDDQNEGQQRSIGHDIDLNVYVDKGHIDDFLRLAGHSPTPLLVGDIAVKAALHIPPGKEPVIRKIDLKGHFDLDDARFTSAKIQDKIEELSLRGQGRPKDAKDAAPDSVRSQMQGDFALSDAVVNLPALKYTVPGAEIQLHGAYGIEGEKLNFHGTVRTDATISQMVGGWKGFLLKPADRFFKKNGAGSQIPIHVLGTREAPDFGLDFGAKKTSPERPGEKPPSSEQ